MGKHDGRISVFLKARWKYQVPEVRASCNKCDRLGLEEEERIPERGIFSKLREDREMMLYHLPVYIFSEFRGLSRS